MSSGDNRDLTLLQIANLRDQLLRFMDPGVLQGLASLLEALGGDNNGFATQYKRWVELRGADCRYSAMAKEFFLKEQAKDVAKEICSLYHKWARVYEKE